MSTTAPTEEKQKKEITNPWREYERRKAELSEDLTPAEREAATRRIADELGI